MVLSVAIRKFLLTLHVICSLGWAGSVAVFVVLDIAALSGKQPELGRLLWLGLDATVWSLLIPLALGSLLTGTALTLGTKWGLFQHYWVLLKLILTSVATLVLVLYTHTIDPLAKIAADPVMSGVQMPSALLHTCGALVVLVLATILAVYKPRGMTRYGQKKRQQAGTQSTL
ncbi:hypothetical protein [Arthrobacter sp. EpRS71]|uniref:hypothetical protein n=1 Tax=Arthrobacter sp. EpRS71 TaxID=1743141 RepID=UPI0007496C62|nr:hypothetical protein [Arthrobacter sp. EpRS71]KUM36451.1 hypothetical protein AR689_21260 [Arthrobacter sp. EpRS71]